MPEDSATLPRAEILERIASGAPIVGTLDEIVLHVEALLPGAVGSVLLLDGQKLRAASVVRLPPSYNAAVEGVTIGASVASCGTAAWGCKPVYVADIENDPLWATFKDVALAHELRACWSVPILSRRKPERRVLGTFAVYFQEPREIDVQGISVLSQAEKLACIALEAEAAANVLREEGARFRTFVDHSLDGFFLHERDGTLVDVNRQACASLGYTREELIGKIPSFVDPDATPALLRAIEMKMDAGESVQFESRHRRKDGTIRSVEVRCKPVETDGRRMTLTWVRDVTERRTLEEQLHHARRLEAIGRLAGGIAHDFNNLLTVVEVSTELLLAQIPEDSPLRADVVSCQQAGARAAELTSQLLAFGRQSLVAPRPLDLNVVVERTAAMLDRVIGENILLSTRLAPTLRKILADVGQIEQVLMNLAVNARDAMPRGGTLEIITVELEDIEVDPKQGSRGRTVCLTVADSGAGMTPEVQSRLFEPYFTTKGPGRGLGLATVYGIVTQSGGEVHVDSAPGRGSRITARFPATDEEAPVPAIEHGPAAGGAEVILLVEDENEVRRLTARALTGSGYEVLAARSADEALAMEGARTGALHLLVTDVVMPHRGGRELVDAVRKRRPDIKVLFISGYTDDEIVRQGVTGASDAFLQKPFTPSILARKVREVLDAPSR